MFSLVDPTLASETYKKTDIKMFALFSPCTILKFYPLQ